MEIKANSAEQAFHLVLDEIKNKGIETFPRGLRIKELINCCIEIENPRDRIVYCPERAMNMAYAFGELIWYLSGDNDLSTMEYYSKFMKDCSDDGKTLNSAYGYRIFTGKHSLIPFNQWENVKRILSEDKDSRQAIIHLHTPNDKKTKDEVCTLTLQFFIRNDKLDMITTMRSNDIYLGFVYDVFCFTMLQEMMANELNVEIGKYYHNAGSMHIYENRFELLERHTRIELGPMNPFAYTHTMFGQALLIGFERELREAAAAYKELKKQVENVEEYSECNRKFISEMYIRRVEIDKSTNLLYFAKMSLLIKCAKEMDASLDIQNWLLDKVREKNECQADMLQYIGSFSREGKKLIVCGIDGAGKSYYVDDLFNMNKELYGRLYEVQHYCKPSEKFGYEKNYILNLVNNRDIIFDRFFPSEVVYSDVLRRESKISDYAIWSIICNMDKDKVKFIFIIPQSKCEWDCIFEGLKEEDWNLKKHLRELNAKYIEFAKWMQTLGFEVEIRQVRRGK